MRAILCIQADIGFQRPLLPDLYVAVVIYETAGFSNIYFTTIKSYCRFTDILGINNHFAASKAELALKWISDNNLDKNNTVFIGDTTHDFETASAAGCP